MTLLHTAAAGTLESSDCYVTVSPDETFKLKYSGANIEIFTKRTERLVKSVLDENNIACANVTIEDRGAIEITIKARLETALERASTPEHPDPSAQGADADAECGSAVLASWWKSVTREEGKR